MATLRVSAKPVLLVPARCARTSLMICNLTDSTIYLSPDGKDVDSFTSRAWPVKIDGILDAMANGKYLGPIYAMTETESDVRVWET